jgi:hypothetical protein
MMDPQLPVDGPGTAGSLFDALEDLDFLPVRALSGVQAPLAFSIVNRFCMAVLYGRTGRLIAKNGGFRPG